MCKEWSVESIVKCLEVIMAFDKNWRPEDWTQIKENMLNGIPIAFSPSTGYSKADKDKIMEATASVVLGALAAVIVTEP